MPSPRDDPYLLAIWKNLEREYISSGLSRWGALRKIASEYSVSQKTVYFWLSPEQRAHKLALDKSEIGKKRKRDWAMRPQNKARLYEYSRNYQNIRNNLHSYIQELFIENNEMSLLSISKKLKDKTNIRFNRKIILAAIAKYNYGNEENPIIEIYSELYRMSVEPL